MGFSRRRSPNARITAFYEVKPQGASAKRHVHLGNAGVNVVAEFNAPAPGSRKHHAAHQPHAIADHDGPVRRTGQADAWLDGAPPA